MGGSGDRLRIRTRKILRLPADLPVRIRSLSPDLPFTCHSERGSMISQMKLLAIAWVVFSALGVAQVAPGGLVSGTIKLPSGAPAAGIRVWAMTVQAVNTPANEASVFVSITQTDGSGRYRLENIPPGRYYVAAGAVLAPDYYPGTPNLDTATVVTLRDGTVLTRHDFSLVPSSLHAVKVSGKVVNIAREWTVSTLIVRLISSATGGPTMESAVNADRSFAFADVPVGTYRTWLNGLIAGGAGILPAVVVGSSDVANVTIDLRDNPFPEFPGGSHANFDRGNPVTIRGVVTQGVTQSRPPAPARYFRLDVKDERTGIVTPWAVALNRDWELLKFNVGDSVTVTGAGSRDGTHRLFLMDAVPTSIANVNDINAEIWGQTPNSN